MPKLDTSASGEGRLDGNLAKVSIMQVFRRAYEENDAARAAPPSRAGEGEVSERSRPRRDGITVAELQDQIAADLEALLSTVNNDSAVSLDSAPHVARSIVNFGFRDLSALSAKDLSKADVIDTLRRSLIDYEPRLVPDTILVEIVENGTGEPRQRVRLRVNAEFKSDPVDIRLDFDAEVDFGAGKLNMARLQVQS